MARYETAEWTAADFGCIVGGLVRLVAKALPTTVIGNARRDAADYMLGPCSVWAGFARLVGVEPELLRATVGLDLAAAAPFVRQASEGFVEYPAVTALTGKSLRTVKRAVVAGRIRHCAGKSTRPARLNPESVLLWHFAPQEPSSRAHGREALALWRSLFVRAIPIPGICSPLSQDGTAPEWRALPVAGFPMPDGLRELAGGLTAGELRLLRSFHWAWTAKNPPDSAAEPTASGQMLRWVLTVGATHGMDTADVYSLLLTHPALCPDCPNVWASVQDRLWQGGDKGFSYAYECPVCGRRWECDRATEQDKRRAAEGHFVALNDTLPPGERLPLKVYREYLRDQRYALAGRRENFTSVRYRDLARALGTDRVSITNSWKRAQKRHGAQRWDTLNCAVWRVRCAIQIVGRSLRWALPRTMTAAVNGAVTAGLRGQEQPE